MPPCAGRWEPVFSSNREVVQRGLMNKDRLIECLLDVQRAVDTGFAQHTQTQPALQLAKRFVTAEFRSGKLPVAPRVWGRLIGERLKLPG